MEQAQSNGIDMGGRYKHRDNNPINTNTGSTSSMTIGATLSNEQAQLGSLGEEKVEEAAEDEFLLGGVIEETAPGENEAGDVSSAAATCNTTVKYASDNDVVELNEEQQNETGDSTLSGSAVPPSEHLENNAGEGGATNAVNMEHTEINVGEDIACQGKCCVIL